jgi:N-acetylmuramoyl-L-alanine amidase
MIPHPSPNFDARSAQSIDMLVLHYTDMFNWKDALTRLSDPEARVSAHYLVNEDGEVYTMVDEANRAWHAGESAWRGHSNINTRSVGIEISNPGHSHGLVPFPEKQMLAVVELSKGIVNRHSIPGRNVVGHSDIAFLRKDDPGELFDWPRLAKAGVGVFPFEAKHLTGSELKREDTGTDVMKLQTSLANWGYGLKLDGRFGEKTEKCVIAFQRHYRPQEISGIWDNECSGLLAALHGLV